jgi:peptide/nickel transport system substrate-binding protein/oligopeptide transport system substrate-binding protein
MKKFTAVSMALVLSLGILTGCGGDNNASTPLSSDSQASGTQSSEVQSSETQASGTQDSGLNISEENAVDPHNWGAYDSLITEIRTTTDFAQREVLMHQAEDMLMETGALLPLYYYNDVYMQKGRVSNVYSNLFGYKFFMFAKTEGNTLRLNIGSEPDKLDPALNSSVDGACLAVNSFAGLYTYDDDCNAIPDLAADEQISEDGMTYTITLLPDLKWSDGSELNANDFIYAWNRAIDSKTASDYGYMFDIVARNDDGTLKVTASEDAQTLTIELIAPCAYFNELLAFPTYFPVKQSEVEGQSDWETNPGAWAQEAGFITNGAYTLTSWTHDESMTYTKNPNYHRADEVEIETLQFMLSDDDTAIFAAYNADNLDFIDTVPTDEIQSLLSNPEFYIVDQLGTYYVSFNVNSPLFEGKTAAQANAMRRAFALLVDRDYICENIGQTGQKPANTFIPIGMADGNGGVFKENDADYTFPNEASVGYYDPVWSQANVDEAIALLEYAGYKFENGMLSVETPISFEYLTNNTSGHIAIAEALQQDFAQIGVNMSINSIDWAVFLNERKEGNYDIARNGWLADFSDPINMLEMWTTESGNNDCQFGK